jgi:hypothetical protein
VDATTVSKDAREENVLDWYASILADKSGLSSSGNLRHAARLLAKFRV